MRPAVLILIPTYNEVENIAAILDRILRQRKLLANRWTIDVLVIDDNSPDGTASVLSRYVNQNIYLMERATKAGLGPAYLAGFTWGLARDYQYFMEMDADGSHQPEEIGELLDAILGNGLVIGTRWMRGGVVENWPVFRRFISKFGTFYARIILRIPYKDLTSGFRVLSRSFLERLDFDSIQTIGYGFQIEIALLAHELGVGVVETPMTFIERTSGRSKMSKEIVYEAWSQSTLWAIKRLFNRR